MYSRTFGWCVFFSVLVFSNPPRSASAQNHDGEHLQKSFALSGEGVYEISLDMDAGRLIVLPCDGREVRASIDHSDGDYHVDADFDKNRRFLRLEFDLHNWSGDSEDVDAEVRVELPLEAKLRLKAQVKAGEIDIDLGGLALKNLALSIWAGKVRLDFSKPNQLEMEYAEINTRIGKTDIRRLGNARFKYVKIDGGIGELDVDFTGLLLAEARAELDLDIGETSIRLPRDAGVRLKVAKFMFLTNFEPPSGYLKRGPHFYSKDYDGADRTVALNISPGLGELILY